MSESPFVRHRDKVLGYYSTAAWLRAVVLAMWDGSTHKVGLSKLAGVDADHHAAFSEMVAHYRATGENDPAFLSLVEEIQARERDERLAEERAARLEAWGNEVKRCLRERGLRAGELDDRYQWFENAFDEGKPPTQPPNLAAPGTPGLAASS